MRCLYEDHHGNKPCHVEATHTAEISYPEMYFCVPMCHAHALETKQELQLDNVYNETFVAITEGVSKDDIALEPNQE